MTYVEELAREWLGVGPDDDALTLNRAMREARSWIDAIAAIAERGGPKLVRREPTAEMLKAAWHPSEIMVGDALRSFYAMHDAAPAVPEDDV